MKAIHRFCLLAVAALALSLAGIVDNAYAAAPAAGAGIASDALKADSSALVEKVHGCHRRPKVGPWTGLWHRHVGGACIWQKSGPRVNPCKRWRRICRERCYGAPRPKRCLHRCFDNNAPNVCF